MKIVIDIPDTEIPIERVMDTITLFFKNGHVYKCNYPFKELPKGHGDLIDKSKIYKAIPAEEDNCTGMGMTLDEMNAYNEGIDAMYALVKGAKPIIEADKEVLDADSN